MPSWITIKLALIAGAALLAVNAVTVIVYETKLSGVRTDLKETRASLMTCVEDKATYRDNQLRLEQAILDRNAKIKALEEENRRRATLAAAAAKKALSDGENRKAEAARLGSGPDVMNLWMKELYQ